MLKHIRCVISIIIATTIILITSCKEDNPPSSAQPPVFKKIILNPSEVESERTIVATVEYDYPGKDIFKSTYQLKIVEVGDYNNNYLYEWTEVNPVKSNPTYTFKAPSKIGQYNVIFNAKYINFSSGGPKGSLYGSANTISTTLIVKKHE